jgi:hypothetical protein
MDKYLIKYLVESSDDKLTKKYLDFFRAELDWQIYISETHMSKNYFRNHKLSFTENLKRFYQYTSGIVHNSKKSQSSESKVLSTLKVPLQHRQPFYDLGIALYSPIWHPLGKKNIFGDYKTYRWHQDIQHRIKNEDFNSFLDRNFHLSLEEFKKHLSTQYQEQDFKALFLYTDQYFYSKYFIDIFKDIDRPSFVFTHGLPGIYSKEIDNRSDYLMVWSDKIRENYINAGFDAEKVKVVGHPIHHNLDKEKTLRSDLSNVLVVPVSSVTWHQHEYNNTVVNDASMVVLYLYKVQNVLSKLGVKKARYRPHPSINKKWIQSFLDTDFFILDNEPLTASLNKSSIVLGANSTIVLEALMHSVNYVAFDPKDDNGLNMSGYKSVPPFDGSEEKLVLAVNEDELEERLKENALTEYSLVHDFIQNLDLNVLKELIK